MGSNPTLSDFVFEVPPDLPMTLRWAEEADAEALRLWLLEPGVLRWFPMATEAEVDDAVRYWLPCLLGGYGITALVEGKPIGLANLNRHPFKRLSHHALISIIIGDPWRGKGMGTALLKNLIRLAKAWGAFEFLMLEVYEGNPAERLYQRMGFFEVGRQPHFLREPDGTLRAKIIMQRPLEVKDGGP